MILMLKARTLVVKNLPLFLFAIVAIVSYLFFLKYQPKVLRKIEEVKGTRTIDALESFYPGKVDKLAANKTTEGTQIIYNTTKSQEQLIQYYKYLFADFGWEVESLGLTETSFIYKFKKDSKLVTIIAQKGTDYSTVSLEIGKR
jgi:hypothetical protein